MVDYSSDKKIDGLADVGSAITTTTRIPVQDMNDTDKTGYADVQEIVNKGLELSGVTADANIGDHNLVRGDGGAKKIQECSTITVDDSGRMVNTGQPCFLVMLTSEQGPFNADIWYDVNFDNEKFDVGNNFASKTFTAPVAGKYLLTVSLIIVNLQTDADKYIIQVSTTNRDHNIRIDPNFTGVLVSYPITATVVVDMDVNDTAKITVRQYSGTEDARVHTDSFFSGALIC